MAQRFTSTAPLRVVEKMPSRNARRTQRRLPQSFTSPPTPSPAQPRHAASVAKQPRPTMFAGRCVNLPYHTQSESRTRPNAATQQARRTRHALTGMRNEGREGQLSWGKWYRSQPCVHAYAWAVRTQGSQVTCAVGAGAGGGSCGRQVTAIWLPLVGVIGYRRA